MPLTTGSRLGPYEIISTLGVGGMGEVYRARDTRLQREVAVKVLLPAIASDPDRLARFGREAQLLAALNHPNIAAVYGVEEADGASAIILELVEGETLAEKLATQRAQGRRLEIDEAIAIARQLVDALETAHERGIIHRDLKPANIKITPEGRVKVLDFGLAKLADGRASPSGERGAANFSMSPTLSLHGTFAGVILGTAAYMSPEQARGKPVDRRTDIWAFGCVLFEMLAGQQTFESGDTISDAVAAILKNDPDWTALPADTPAHVRSILRRCLQKDVQKRLPHIGVVRLELDEGAEASTASAPAVTPLSASRPLWKRVIPVVVAAAVVGALAATAAWMLKPSAPLPIARFSIALGEDQRFAVNSRQVVAISPDGTQIAYAANLRLYVRSLSEVEGRPISGSQAMAGAVSSPVFSPDSRSIAFASVADRTIKRIALSGGAAVTVCAFDTNTPPSRMSWGPDGILFEQNGKGILRVSSNGGKPELLVAAKADELMHGPQMLPDGQTVLFTMVSGTGTDAWENARIVTHSLKSGERKTLVDGGSEGRYIPTGHIAYVLRGALFAVPFDARRQKVTGGPVPLVEGILTGGSGRTAHYSFSPTGSLVYIPGVVSGASAPQRQLALIDRKGHAEPLKLPAGQYDKARVSPDGKRVALGVDDGTEQMIGIYDLSGTSAMRRLTFGGKDRFPLWSADGQWIAFQSDRDGDAAIFWQPVDGGTAERLTKPEQGTIHVPESWSPDGKELLFGVTKGSIVSLWTFSLRDRKAAPFAAVRSSLPINATFSPDGRWVAYQSTETGTAQVFVQPVPPTGAQYQISKTISASFHPLWSPDGKELFYVSGRDSFAVVSVTTRPSFAVTDAVPVPRGGFFDGGPQTVRNYDIAHDGRIVGVVPVGQGASGAPRADRIEVVLNWFEDLKQRMALK